MNVRWKQGLAHKDHTIYHYITLAKHDSIVDKMVCNSQATTFQKSWFTWKWKELGHWIMFSFHEFCMVYFSNDRFLHVPWKEHPSPKKVVGFQKLLVKLIVSNGTFRIAKVQTMIMVRISWALPWFRLVSFHKHGSCSTSLNVRKWAADETQSPLKQKISPPQ